jgi:hypothetical protein
MGKEDLYNQYGLLMKEYEREYGLHSDEYNQLLDALGIAKDDYYRGGDMFYAEQSNKNDIEGKKHDDSIDIYSAAYAEQRDEIEDEQWLKQFEAVYGNKSNAPSGGSSGGGNTGGNNEGGSTYNNGSLSAEQVKALQKALGVTADGMYGPNSQKAAGGLSAEEAYAKFVGKDPTVRTNPMDFDRDALGANQKEKGGSYYNDVLGDLKEMKTNGKSNAEVGGYLRELLANSLISPSEMSRLYNLYRDNKL